MTMALPQGAPPGPFATHTGPFATGGGGPDVGGFQAGFHQAPPAAPCGGRPMSSMAMMAGPPPPGSRPMSSMAMGGAPMGSPMASMAAGGAPPPMASMAMGSAAMLGAGPPPGPMMGSMAAGSAPPSGMFVPNMMQGPPPDSTNFAPGGMAGAEVPGPTSGLSADNVIPVWYPAENNWQLCMQKMGEEYQRVLNEFSGQWSEEQRAIEASRMDKAADYLASQTEGRLGKRLEPKTRTAHVVDIFQDWSFPGSNASWYRGGEPGDDPQIQPPAFWKRLQEFSLDIPYPMVNAVSGSFNPHGGRVYQGAAGDFYLVAAMQAISMKPLLIANLFVDMHFSNPRMGVYTLRLYKHGQWHDVQIDDALPFDAKYNPLCSTSEFFPDLSWPSLVEKAYAKLHGSWEGLGGGGHVEEVLVDLTGGCASRFGTDDVAPDRLWQYLHEMMPWCVFGCNINEAECSKRQVPIEAHWASAIWSVRKHNGIPYVCVCCSAPVATLRHLPFCDIPSPDGHGVQDGFVWLRVDDFCHFFDTVYECRLVNTDFGRLEISGIPCSPGYIGGFPWFEEMWAFQGDVLSETSPSFLIEITEAPSVITLEVSQTDIRYSDPHEEKESGRGIQAPLLLRFYECSREVSDMGGGEIYLVHLSAWGHCRDASCGVKVLRPGKYLAMVSMPARYTCKGMIFRTYSNRPIAMKPITSHRSWIPVNPARPLDAIPYSLAGFQRVDAYSERLPQMFDEAEGRGKPMANAQQGSLRGREFGAAWQKRWAERQARSVNRDAEGLKVVGTFGGRDAIASVEASETQDACCIS